MSKTLKMIVNELPKTMGQLNHELLLEDLKIALKEVEKLEQQLQQDHHAGFEEGKKQTAQECASLILGKDWQTWKCECENDYECTTCRIKAKFGLDGCGGD